MSNYTGICLVGTKIRNLVTHVKVRDPSGSELPLPLADYISRGIQPPHAELPWCEDRGS